MEETKKEMHWFTASLVCIGVTTFAGWVSLHLANSYIYGAIGLIGAIATVWGFFILPAVIGSDNMPLTYLTTFIGVMSISVFVL